jgi:hypothetical protein
MTGITPHIREPSRPWVCFASCIAAALFAILAAALDWSLIDRFPALMFMPGHLLVSLVPLTLASIWSVLQLFRVRSGGLLHAAPLAVCATAFVILAGAPFTRIWLGANFWLHAAEREQIVRAVARGKLRPNVAHNASLIGLGPNRSHVSAGGNEIMVETRAGKPWVLFFTFRGINHYSGFLHVPDGGDPETFADRRHQIVPWTPTWYFVAR